MKIVVEKFPRVLSYEYRTRIRVRALLVHEFRSRFMEGTLEGRAVMVLDPSLNQSELRKGAAGTSDLTVCLLSRIGGPVERAFAEITINECASVPHDRIGTGFDNHALAINKRIVMPATLVSAPAAKLDPSGPVNNPA